MDQTIGELAVLVALLLVLGVVAGVLAGLLGVGGGIVIVPALFYVFIALDYPEATLMHVCVATSLATIVLTSMRSVASHNKKGAVDWPLLKSWAPYIAVGAVLGVIAADRLRSASLMIVFGVAAFVVALHMAFGRKNWRLGDAPPTGAARGGIATSVGFLSVLMGIGGGTFGVPLLTLFNLAVHRAVATAAGFGLIIAIPSTIGFIVSGWGEPLRPPFTLGYVSLPAFAIIVPMTVLCAPYGVKLAHSLNPRPLKLLFAFFLAVTALNMLRKALYG
ncbi:sulfite exporter TauE/SafE family protein [Pikeienuella piscinae]|uniref:Probable membrane transporter protein n=1 Tax=Pikeienuella piscinae TaxID=2748098 RepID=A0A7L5BVM0_9RHOB|nr:sulfite exporter TauE/SafE family protein [Pikeienuella piscinae]QIE55143.1 sulfite exporter TauE/SafE family protein [Pikeienuella piscinae]